MKVIYVAGRYRAPTPWEIECNIRRAEEVALQVWKLGAAALCPHTNTRFFQHSLPDQTWADGYLELLRRCDAMVTVEGWTMSQGTALEMREASHLGIPVYHLPAELLQLKDWLERQ